MFRLSRFIVRAAATGLGLCFLAHVALVTPGFAAADIPANAFATNADYGKGWKCKRGYRDRNDMCEQVPIPKNAYLDAFGDGWKCERGFLNIRRTTCEPIVVPDNAFLTEEGYDSTGWACERGFRAEANRCIAIAIPANAYLSDRRSEHGWICERGYRESGNRCTALVIPENAHIDYSGNAWECDSSFVKRGGACVLP